MIQAKSTALAPERFYERFKDGRVLQEGLPRITTEDSAKDFKPKLKGLKIFLVNAPIREWSYPNIMPIGQGYIASVALMDGHRVEVLDLNAARLGPMKVTPQALEGWIEERLVKALSQHKPDVIGLGGIVTQYSRIQHMARICKSILPEVPVVLGGGIGSCMPLFMLKRLGVDVVVQEEGEVTFSELLHRVEMKQPLAGVRGVAFRQRGAAGEWEYIDNGLRPSLKTGALGVDALPWPMRGLWPLDDVYRVNPVGHLNWETKWVDGAPTQSKTYSVSMISSRGCPYAATACDYCYSAYLGKSYRLRSPQDVLDEMVFLKGRYAPAYIHFLDDLMLTDYRWALAFCEGLRQARKHNGFEVMWGGACRTNIVADDVIRARKEGRPHMLEQAHAVGMRQAGYGIESGSPTILKSIDKSGQTMEKMELAIRETQRVLGYADCSFMIGSPGESPQTIQETVDFCKRVGLAPEVFFFTTAYPATTFWDLAMERGLIAKAVTGTPGPADEEMVEEYLIRTGEQGEQIRTNFSDMSDEAVVELSWSAINALGAQNVVRHPHTGETQPAQKPKLRAAAQADA